MSFNFNELPIGKNTLVVDALNLAFRWKHQGKTKFVTEYAKTVESLAQSYNCQKIIITADKGSSTFRKNILPSYKQNRKDKYAEQSEEEAEAFKLFFEEYSNTLDYLSNSYTVLQYDGVEADDIAAYIVRYRDSFDLGSIVLISSDRDWDLLVQPGVQRFSYITRKDITSENWYDHYDVSPEQYISYKVLVGDKGDNIPGIKGIGPKRAKTLLDQYGSAFDIYESLPIDGKYKYLEELNASGDRLIENYELMDLITYCADAIGSNNVIDIRERI
jgi:5'-3' exonuclease